MPDRLRVRMATSPSPGESQMKVKHCKIECEGNDIFVIADGVKIARRSRSGTPQAMTWISLEPGWTVRDCQGSYVDESGEQERAIEIEYKSPRFH
jgi:hypothetical protein